MSFSSNGYDIFVDQPPAFYSAVPPFFPERFCGGVFVIVRDRFFNLINRDLGTLMTAPVTTAERFSLSGLGGGLRSLH